MPPPPVGSGLHYGCAWMAIKMDRPANDILPNTVEEPWVPCSPAKTTGHDMLMIGGACDLWEKDRYYGTLRRNKSGFFVGNCEWAIIGITAKDESARHDWRDFQQIKNDVLGREWEAVELYPAESRLVDPSNRFYLWCAPKGCFQFGFNHRKVMDAGEGIAPQRGFAVSAVPAGEGEAKR